ncbi:MAG: TIGR00730 family Rossman fold protein [Alphaproteobacteria bacterium]|nr:TIGR00730 family Rossman fold protein [Alphaproteobacteria bacterium]
MRLKSICVFCGGKNGNDPAFEKAATELGRLIAENGVKLIFGAGGTGLMGAVATSCKQHGGEVIGMTISHLFEIERPDLMQDAMDEIRVFQKLYERKFAMTSAAEAFCVLPGGLGTVDELMELTVLRQLGLFNKPIILLSINGFFKPLKEAIQYMIDEGFMKPEHLNLITPLDKVEDVLPTIEKELKELDKNSK